MIVIYNKIIHIIIISLMSITFLKENFISGNMIKLIHAITFCNGWIVRFVCSGFLFREKLDNLIQQKLFLIL